MRKLLAFLISIYQSKISPHKGFTCAHRALHEGDSCSEFTKKKILEKGLFAGLGSIRSRFDECRYAAQTINKRPPLSQRGDCDLGLSSCDIGDCGGKGKTSLPLDCLDFANGCDVFHSNKKNRTRDLWIYALLFIAVVLLFLLLWF